MLCRLVTRAVSGEGEEHVVEAGLFQLDGDDRHPPGVQAPDRLRRCGRVGHREADLGAAVSTRGGSPAARPASAAEAPGRSLAMARRTRSTLPPIIALSWAAVPWAAMRPRSTTAICCARRSASSRYWVVSSTVVLSRRSSSTMLHSSCRERGSRPVVGSSSRITGGRPIKPAARSSRRRIRRNRSPRAGWPHRPARTARAARPRALARLRPTGGRATDHLEVLTSGELPIDGRELTRQPDPPTHRQRLADDVMPDHGGPAGRWL